MKNASQHRRSFLVGVLAGLALAGCGAQNGDDALPTETGGVSPGAGGSGSVPAATGGALGGQGAIGGGALTGGAGTGGGASGGSGGYGELGGTGGNGEIGGSGGLSVGGTGGDETGGSGGVTGGSAGEGTGGGTGGAGQQPEIGPGPCGCATPAGEYEGNDISETIVVESGEIFDGGCKIYRADPDALGAGDQSEGQLPVFRVNDGGTLRNVVLGASAADGIHVYGDVSLENIHWLDIGEDAMTVKASGTVHLDCGSSANGDDKTFQVNAESTIYISNFTARNAGKFMRQNGGTTFEMSVFIDHCDISGMDECIYRTDSSSSHVTLTNSRYSDIGDGLFIFGSSIENGSSDQSTVSNNQEY